jgi:hypothetical protein
MSNDAVDVTSPPTRRATPVGRVSDARPRDGYGSDPGRDVEARRTTAGDSVTVRPRLASRDGDVRIAHRTPVVSRCPATEPSANRRTGCLLVSAFASEERLLIRIERRHNVN